MRALSIALLLTSAAGSAYSQKFGAAEILGPSIPTPQAIVDRMLQAARIKPGEMVYDLGSGDGRIVITAAQKFGARAVGVEIDPVQCRKAMDKIKSLGLADMVSITEGSALRIDLRPADVVTMFFLTLSNERLKPNFEKQLKPGARVVSTEFPIKGWKPAEVIQVKIGAMDHSIYLYEMGRTSTR
jgi:predicted RNA methylase